MTATLVNCLVETFNREGVIYCHWKSNIDLTQASAGELDLDLLVDRKSLPQALAILLQLGYKAALARWGANPPSIAHYYGLDPHTQQLIHVHLFSRVLTGESLVKGHLLPFEVMLLENAYYVGQMRVTSKPAELVLFTLRMFIKYGSVPDVVSLWRRPDKVKAEVRWLQPDDDRSEALCLLRKYCPVIDEQLFIKCIDTLNEDSGLIKRIMLARQIRRRLNIYAKYTFLNRLLAYAQVMLTQGQRRFGGKRKNKVLQAGGAIIAFVGPDATGKSTLVSETGRWLGDAFTVRVVHAGKPPSSWLTVPVNIVLPFVRRLVPSQLTSRSKNQASSSNSSQAQHKVKGLSSLLYAFRAVALAWDRRRLLLKVRQLVANGEIVICDRYPSQVVGAMDSPRLQEDPRKSGLVMTIYNRLARLEVQLYQQIPPPDIVLKLRVSLETAKKRNRERMGQDGDAYLETRHRQSQEWTRPGIRSIYDIDTEHTLEETVRKVKNVIWASL